MKVAIAGGSGLVGGTLTKKLADAGHEVLILTRNPYNKRSSPSVRYVAWLTGQAVPEESLEGIDAFINLAGESLNSGRWTDAKKQEILDSRIDVTREAVRILHALKQKPSVFINGSAVGYYGTSFHEAFTEEHTEPGNDFLAEVVTRWEKETDGTPEEIRTVCARFGIILSAEGGALKKMLPPFKLGAGGKIGTGEQWMSWIHVEDVANALIFCINNESMSGPVNMTAPQPARMKTFGRTLSDVLNKPFWAPVPSNVLKLVLGDMSVLILEGQQVIPQKLLDAGFHFDYAELEEALYDLVGE
ncbi:TIGR01777 family oxidoreductase [Alkalicoccus urumqiensis]|uniref:TIGR01777 family protein n=1 Tax=Alkalicoccus urumqiensis TaxID=1548213 RepID=A0A2P6MGS0_ALKUR|nr:TIGR01777 family oxidoreductase [Alkalicoccus urumqiensis]PRO65471.1 TIGR01777 family protein [Alkalicoccus urumqiensis]